MSFHRLPRGSWIGQVHHGGDVGAVHLPQSHGAGGILPSREK
jgi:hypothetical protein